MPTPTNFEGSKIVFKDTSDSTAQTLQVTNGAVTLPPTDGAITNAKLAPNAVTNAKIANNAIDDSKVSSLSGSKITDGSITDVKIISLSGNKVGSGIDASNITTGAISNAQISSVDGSKITADSISLNKLFVYGTPNLLRNGSMDEDASPTSPVGWAAAPGPSSVPPAPTTLQTFVTGDGHGDPTICMRPPTGPGRARQFNNNTVSGSGVQYTIYQDVDIYNLGLHTSPNNPHQSQVFYLSGHYKSGTIASPSGSAVITMYSIVNGSVSGAVTFNADSSAGTGVGHWRIFRLSLQAGGDPAVGFGMTSSIIRIAIGANTNNTAKVYIDDLVLISWQTATTIGG